jgi:uncharacterized protein YjlB
MAEPLAFIFEDDGSVPNSTLPLLVYRNAVPADPAAIMALIRIHPPRQMPQQQSAIAARRKRSM